MALKDTIARMAGIDATKHSAYLNDYIPILLEFAEDKSNNTFDQKDESGNLNPPAGVKLFLAESIKFKLKDKGLKSRQMGSVSYSYDTELPDKIVKNLNPYKKVRFK